MHCERPDRGSVEHAVAKQLPGKPTVCRLEHPGAVAAYRSEDEVVVRRVDDQRMIAGKVEALLTVAEGERGRRVVPPDPGLPDAAIIAGDIHHIDVGGMGGCG